MEDISRGVEAAFGTAANFLNEIPESNAKSAARQRRDSRRPHLPVLIIPGFMSTGLTIENSDVKSSWSGKRIWLNLASLGLQKFYNNKETTREEKRDNARQNQNQNRNFAEFSKSVKRGEMDEDSESESDESLGGLENDLEEPLIQSHEEVLSRNLWIKHISLSPQDLKSDPPGVRVRPMEGLAGVDYLTPGTLTGFVSYVFAPVIKVLQQHGYEDGINLDAAPYDWRLSPKHLEERDSYFTKTMNKVEDLYRRNGGMPVVLVCHSLGCRVAQYFLEFANERDASWCKKYVHTYMPVGAPHLGAPFALRALVSGDQMGLQAFLNESEALAMSRTLGSIPWLIPSRIPSYSPENAFVRREGAFEIYVKDIINVAPLLEERADGAKPKKLKLVLRYGKRTVHSKFFPVNNDEVHFDNNFFFSTGPEGPYAKQCCSLCCQCCLLRCACCACCSDNHLIVSICEPGYQDARRTKKRDSMKRKCCSINYGKWFILGLIKWLFIVVGYLLYLVSFKLWLMLVDAFPGGLSELAVGAPIDLRECIDESESVDVEVEVRNDSKQCCKKREKAAMPSIKVNIRWISPDSPEKTPSGSQLSESSDDRYQLIDGLACKQNKKKWTYEPVAGSRILEQELGHDASMLGFVSEIYDNDSLKPRGSLDPPPVNAIKAVYGINLPTEVGAVYKRKTTLAESKRKVKSKFELDTRAKLSRQKRGHHVLDDGVLFETKDTPQMIESEGKSVCCSGDGTVPYWSLQHVRNWKQNRRVEITELDGAPHREILADSRFHEVLINYVTIKADDDDADGV